MSFLERIKNKTEKANIQKEKTRQKEQRKCMRKTKRCNRRELRMVKGFVKVEAGRGRHICTFFCNEQETVSYFQDGGFKVKVIPHKGWIGKFYVEVEWDQ